MDVLAASCLHPPPFIPAACCVRIIDHRPTTALPTTHTTRQQIAIPIRAQGSDATGPLQLAAAGGASQNATENRWLGRMVTNTLGQVRARADMCDNEGALLTEKVAAAAEDGAWVDGWIRRGMGGEG